VEGQQILDIARRTAAAYARPHEREDCAASVALALVEAQARVSAAVAPECYAHRVAQRAAWRWLRRERASSDDETPTPDDRHALAEMRGRYVGCRGKRVERTNRLSRSQVAWAYDLALAKGVVAAG
jgi:hypothetical protein